MARRRIALALYLVLAVACAGKPLPPDPAPPAPRPPTPTGVGYDAAWNAVIAYFAENSVPIKTIDKASGLIVTEVQRVAQPNEYAWCGWTVVLSHRTEGKTVARRPDAASYNVLVRPTQDGKSNLRVTATWSASAAAQSFSCISADSFEQGLEAKLVEMAKR